METSVNLRSAFTDMSCSLFACQRTLFLSSSLTEKVEGILVIHYFDEQVKLCGGSYKKYLI